jgi:hypothetical protein
VNTRCILIPGACLRPSLKPLLIMSVIFFTFFF